MQDRIRFDFDISTVLGLATIQLYALQINTNNTTVSMSNCHERNCKAYEA
jgi:hypothetical protein